MLTKIEFNTLKKLSDEFSKEIPKPDLLIYIQIESIETKKRIKNRNRLSEKEILPLYLQKLGQQFETFVKTFKECPVMKINSNNMDLRQRKTVDNIINDMYRYLRKQ